MNAIRQFKEVKDNRFEITLPEGFNAKLVEVIIIPAEHENEVSIETKKMLDERLTNFEENSTFAIDFEKFMEDLENN